MSVTLTYCLNCGEYKGVLKCNLCFTLQCAYCEDFNSVGYSRHFKMFVGIPSGDSYQQCKRHVNRVVTEDVG